MKLVIKNDGPRIGFTNYWETENADAGQFYLSVVPGCVRLLVPPIETAFGEIQLAASVITLTLGALDGAEGAIEILFDHPPPAKIFLQPDQVDRPWGASEEGPPMPLLIYSDNGNRKDATTCVLRRAERLPTPINRPSYVISQSSVRPFRTIPD